MEAFAEAQTGGVSFVTLRVTYKVLKRLSLPPFRGSLWRGALGWALKRVCCTSLRAVCQECVRADNCLYFSFYGQPKRAIPSRPQPSPPRPFVLHLNWLDCEQRYLPGDNIGFGLTVFGEAAWNRFHELILAFKILGQGGVGRSRIPLDLVHVEAVSPLGEPPGTLYEDGRLFPPPEPWFFSEQMPTNDSDLAEIEVYLSSPLILRRHGRHRDSAPTFSDLICALHERWRGLASNYAVRDEAANASLPEGKSHDLELARIVQTMEDQTYWHSCSRYSSREDKKQSLSGLMGRVHYTDVPVSLIPLLHFGVLAHIGNGTSMGMGAYALRIDDSSFSPVFWSDTQTE